MIQPALSEDAKAVLLLCCPLTPKSPFRPLSLGEYNSLATVLYKNGFRPADVLQADELQTLASSARIEDENRLESLLSQRGNLGFLLEQWQQMGIWIVSRADSSYPERIKRHLGHHAPPVLFGIGDAALLQKGGLGMVGSRDVDQAGADFARATAILCAESMIPVVSGGARGVDSIAMLAAADHGGTAVGFLAESLYRRSLSRDFREHIAGGRILLLSPYHPMANFSVGAAMGRNKLIYAQSGHTLVISSGLRKGGTWAGAAEELKRRDHRTVFVRNEAGIPEGNRELIRLGGLPWTMPADTNELKNRLINASPHMQGNRIEHAKDAERSSQLSLLSETLRPAGSTPAQKAPSIQSLPERAAEPEAPAISQAASKPAEAIFAAVLPILCESLRLPATARELAERFDVAQGQMRTWLERALSEKIVEKDKGRYRLTGPATTDCAGQQGN